MGKNDLSYIGEEIKHAVQDAIDSMDFKELNKTISGTINEALDEVNKHIKPTAPPRPKMQPQSKSQPQPPPAPPKAEIMVHPPSQVAGILLTVFGSIGLGLSLAGLLASLIIALLTPSWVPAGGLAVLMGITAAISTVLLGCGNSIRGKSRRLKLYLKEAGGKNYCSVRALMGRVGKPEKYVVKDLKKMIRTGILPHAHMDKNNTCLMLNDDAYKQYQQSLEALKLRTQELKTPDTPKIEVPKTPDHKIRVTAEGRRYLDTLRDARKAIPGEVISAKLHRLETVVEKIFYVVDMHPEQLDDIERFIDYYLPTTVKLVTAYRNFDSAGITGGNISMAKQEVEQTLDTINLAFEHLLDDLYQEEAFDISTDASVLQAILKKDGFVNSDFDSTDNTRTGGTYEPK